MKTNTLVAAAIAGFFSISAYAQTVDEIVDKHIAAQGGMDKLKNVKTLYMERSLSVQGTEIPNKTTLVVGKSLRSESSIMGNPFIQVVNGSTGWMIQPTVMGGSGNTEDMPAVLLKEQLGQLDPFGPLFNYKEKGNTVELVGKEKIDGKEAYHFKVTTKEGLVVEEFIDANTYLASKFKMPVNGQPTDMSLSDYQEVDGIKFPKTMEIPNEQAGNLVFITGKITINPPVDDAIFKKPAK